MPSAATVASVTSREEHAGASNKSRHFRNLLLPLVALAVLVLLTSRTPGFATVDNLRAVLVNASVVGVLAVAMTPVAVSGNFFSLGTHQSVVLSALIFLSWVSADGSPLIGILLVLLTQIVIGVAQALIVSTGLNPVITTLAVGSILFGGISIATDGRTVTAGSADVSWLGLSSMFGLPSSVYYFVAFAGITDWALRKTVWGQQLFLVGANRDTAQVSGLSRRKVTLVAYVCLSIGCALAGLILSAQIGQVAATDFSTLTIDVLAALLIGGTSIAGGRGSALRSAIGAVFIALLSNVLRLHGLGAGETASILGATVLLSAIALHLNLGARR